MTINNDIDTIILEKDPNTFELIRDILNKIIPSRILNITSLDQVTPQLLSNKNLKYFFCGFEIGKIEDEHIESLAMSLLIQYKKNIKYIPYPYLDKADLLFSKNKVLLLKYSDLTHSFL